MPKSYFPVPIKATLKGIKLIEFYLGIIELGIKRSKI